MILVTGAETEFGQILVRRLQGESFLALVPDQEDASKVAGQYAVGDIGEFAGMLNVLESITKLVIYTEDNPYQIRNQRNLIQTAVESGTVRQIIKVSGGTEVAGRTNSPVAKAHWEIEQVLADCGIPYTILRHSLFNQTLMSLIGGMVQGSNKITLPLKSARIGLVDMRDAADVILALLHQSSYGYETVDVTGGEALNMQELADLLSRLLGRSIKYRPQLLWRFRLGTWFGTQPSWLTEHQIAMFRETYWCGHGALITFAVNELAEHPPITVEEFLKDYYAIPK